MPTSERMVERGRKSGPIKIFYFIDSLHLGGSENQLVQMALRLDRARFKVTVGCLHAEGPLVEPLQKAGIEVVEFDPKGGVGSPSSLWPMLRLSSFLRRKRFDVVHTFDLYSNLMGLPAAWLARVPLRISSRRDLGSWWWYTPSRRRVLRLILARSHVMVTNSEAARKYVVRENQYPLKNIRVVRNGIDIEHFASIGAERMQVLPGLSEGDKIVTMVANMNSERKGHAELVGAAGVVCTQVPEAKFVLVGDGRERAGLEQQVQETGLQGKVIFLGRRTDVPEILKCSDLCVLPSWAEGLPNVVMESVAVGKPVVATHVGGIPEIIEDGVSGLLVPPRDPAALAAAIIRLLEDPNLARGMARVALGTLRERFSFSRVIQELEDLYLTVRLQAQ